MSTDNLPMWASEFSEIPGCIARNVAIRDAMLELLSSPMAGKVTEGEVRIEATRQFFRELIMGEFTLGEAYQRVEQRLPRENSEHSASNRIFPQGWGERLVRTQFSRLYTQSVLLHILKTEEASCFVPHSHAASPDSPCTLSLAGGSHDAQRLLNLLVDSYEKGEWTKDAKVPHHPHCTHVVRPSEPTGNA